MIALDLITCYDSTMTFLLCDMAESKVQSAASGKSTISCPKRAYSATDRGTNFDDDKKVGISAEDARQLLRDSTSLREKVLAVVWNGVARKRSNGVALALVMCSRVYVVAVTRSLANSIKVNTSSRLFTESLCLSSLLSHHFTSD